MGEMDAHSWAVHFFGLLLSGGIEAKAGDDQVADLLETACRFDCLHSHRSIDGHLFGAEHTRDCWAVLLPSFPTTAGVKTATRFLFQRCEFGSAVPKECNAVLFHEANHEVDIAIGVGGSDIIEFIRCRIE